MADRDFAQLQVTVRPDDGESPGFRSFLLVAGILLVVLLGFAGGYWIGSRNGHKPEETAARGKLLAQLKQQKKELVKLRQQASKAKTSNDTVPKMAMGDLTFYTDLPKQSVKPEPLSQPAPTAGISSSKAGIATPPAIASGVSSMPHKTDKARAIQSGKRQQLNSKTKGAVYFYVQAGSFRDMKAVDVMLHKLEAVNLNTTIRRVHIMGKGIWYRLLVGPYASRALADSARLYLARKMHLKGIVIHDGG